MPRVAPLSEVSRVIDGRKITRLTRLDEAAGAPYDTWVTEPAEVAGQGRIWRDIGWSATASPAERYASITGMIRVREPEPTDREQVAANLAKLRLQAPDLAAAVEAKLNAGQAKPPAGGLFDVGRVSVSLNVVAGPPSASFLTPAQLDEYLLRHSKGESAFGTVKPYAELGPDERFCPPKFGHCAESSAAIETGHGLVISAYDVWAPDRPMTRRGDGVVIVSLLVPGRPTETTVASTRDAISF